MNGVRFIAGRGRSGQVAFVILTQVRADMGNEGHSIIFLFVFSVLTTKRVFFFPVSAYPEVNNNREKVKQFLPPPTNAFLYLILSFRNSNEKAV